MNLANTLKSFTVFIIVKTIAKLNPEHSDKYEIKIWENSRRVSRSLDNAELLSKTIAMHVRFESWYISLSSSTK